VNLEDPNERGYDALQKAFLDRDDKDCVTIEVSAMFAANTLRNVEPPALGGLAQSTYEAIQIHPGRARSCGNARRISPCRKLAALARAEF
jgi:hypothetical protein